MSVRFGVIASVIAVCLFVTSAVLAHAELVSAEPAAGETVAAPPAQLILTFNEPIGGDSRVQVVDNQFNRLEGVTSAVGAAPDQLIATLPLLEPGVYTVEYDAVSADGHTIRGSYEFAVGELAAEGLSPFVWAGGLLLLLFGAVMWRLFFPTR